MAGFTINNSANHVAIATTFTNATQQLSVQAVTATITTGFINELAFGPSGLPASTDCSIEWQLARNSAALTTGGGAVTPAADNQASRASGMSCVAGGTGGSTFGTIVYDIGLNQRASYRWTAIPGQEIVIPATNFAGFCLGGLSPNYTGNAGCAIHWFE